MSSLSCYRIPIPGTGKNVAKALEPFRLMWLEEPVPPEDIDAMAAYSSTRSMT